MSHDNPFLDEGKTTEAAAPDDDAARPVKRTGRLGIMDDTERAVEDSLETMPPKSFSEAPRMRRNDIPDDTLMDILSDHDDDDDDSIEGDGEPDGE